MSKKGIEIFKLEDRVLFEAAAVAEIAEAMENDPNANMSETDRQAQEAKDAIKNAPVENAAAQSAQPDMSDPSAKSDIDAEIQALIEGEIGFSDAVNDAVNGLLNEFGADAVSEAIDDAFAIDETLSVTANTDVNISVDAEQELVIINSTVNDAEDIIAALSPNQEALVLESGRDAFEQINEYLEASGKNYSAIHIMSHGDEGYFILNGQMVSEDNFNAENWAAIGQHITQDGDILLYGCNLAANESGQHLVSMIADASGADVAASIDNTGFNGNWDLEYSSGLVETTSITVENYHYSLATYTVTNYNDSGAGSLRNGLSTVNNTDIVFNVSSSGTIKLTSGQIDLSIYGGQTLTINALNSSRAVTIDGNGHRIFSFNDASKTINLTLSNVTLINGNAGTGNGGAIYLNGSVVTMRLADVDIKDSSAVEGGAIYMKSNTGAATLYLAKADDLAPYNVCTISNTTGAEVIKMISAGAATFNTNSTSGNVTISGSNGDGVVIEAKGAVSACVAPLKGTFTVENHAGNGMKINSGSTISFYLGSSTSSGASSSFVSQHNDGWGVILNAPGNITFNEYYGRSFTFSDNGMGGLQAITGGNFTYGGNTNGKGIIAEDNAGTGVYIEATGNVTYTTLPSLTLRNNERGMVIEAGGDVSITKNNQNTVVISDHEKGGLLINAGGKVSIDVSTVITVSDNSIYAILVNAAGNINFSLSLGSSNNNSTFSNNIVAGNGGAISLNSANGNISFTNSASWQNPVLSFENNTAAGDGGAIYINAMNGNVSFTMTGTTVSRIFTNNTAGGKGGAIFLNAGGNINFTMAAPVITFTGNNAGGDGGAIYMNAGGNVTAVMGTVYSHVITFGGDGALKNTADGSGGALYMKAGGNAALDVTGKLTFTKNEALAGDGGAFYFNAGGAAVMNLGLHAYDDDEGNWLSSYVVFDTNTAKGSGGGLYAVGGSSLKISMGEAGKRANYYDINFLNNTSQTGSGGGLYLGNSAVTLLAAQFIGNTAALAGGAIYQAGGTLSATSARFNGNTASNVVYSGGSVTVKNATLYGNTGNAIQAAGNLTTENATFYNNTGAAALVGGNLQMVNTTVTANGGIYAVSVTGNALVMNSILTGNTGSNLSVGGSEFYSLYSIYGSAADYVGATGDANAVKASTDVFEGTFNVTDGAYKVNADIVGVLLGIAADGSYVYAKGGQWYDIAGGIVTTVDAIGNDQAYRGRSTTDSNIGAYQRSSYLAWRGISDNILEAYEFYTTIQGGIDDVITYNLTENLYLSPTTIVITTALNVTGSIKIFGTADANGRFTTLRVNTTYQERTLTGAGASSNRLFNVTGGDVEYNDMILIGGYSATGKGMGIYIDGANTVTLNNVTASEMYGLQGGAVHNVNAHLIVNDSLFIANRTQATGSNAGAAIYSLGKLTINRSIFIDNVAGNLGQGGAIYYGGTSDWSIDDSIFHFNRCNTGAPGYGGAIYSTGGNTLYLANNEFTENVAAYGGAIYFENGILNIGVSGVAGSGGTFDRNAAPSITNYSSSGNGGTIYLTGTSTANIYNAKFVGSTAGLQGGTFWAGEDVTTNFYAGNVFSIGSVAGNHAGHGGFMYNAGTAIFHVATTIDGFRAGSNGGAFYNSGSISFENVSTISNNSATSGGGFYNSGSITFNDEAAISRNSASGSGGGIYNIGGALDFKNGVTFSTNSASTGGALYAATSGTLKMNGTKAVFYGNRANSSSGGAIYVNYSFELINGEFEFENNYARNWGGAIYSNATSLTIDNCTFTTNTSEKGGAIYKTGGTLTIGTKDVSADGSSAIFTGNSTFTASNDYGGGAIYMDGASKLNVYGAKFVDNKATRMGGAIFTVSGTTSYIDSKTVFDNLLTTGSHAVIHGGILYNLGTMTVDIAAGTTIQNGRAGSNGGFAANGSSGILTVNVIGDGKVTFRNNYATGSGGMIYNAGGTVTFNGNFVFDNNSAGTYGGALYNVSAGILTINGKSEFTNNKVTAAGGNGGAIYTTGNLILNDKAIFTGNTTSTSGYGGAIYAGAYTLTIAYGSEFTDNHAGWGGGAIYKTGGVLNIGTADGAKGSAVFTSNYTNGTSTNSIYGGGAIYMDGASTVNVYGATFENNTATVGGGTLYINSSATANIDASTVFVNTLATSKNHAANGGLIYNLGKTTLNVKDGTVFENYRTSGGSGVIGNSGGTLTINGDVVFKNNKSGTNGGAIFNSGTATINGKAEFYTNKTVNGGAIYNSGTFNLGTDAIFKGNEATTNGGAINSISIFNLGTGALFEGNSATQYGGAIFNSGSSFMVTDAKFITNTAGYGGGAIRNTGTMKIEESLFEENSISIATGVNYGGGAISNIGTMDITAGSKFDTNSGKGLGGGAIFNSSAGTMTVDGTYFLNNTTSGTNGGGAIINAGKLSITNSVFEKNSATVAAGAIYNSGNLYVETSTFVGNSSTTSGGAISTNNGTFTIVNSTFYNNLAQSYGGAICFNVAGGLGYIIDSTFVGNSAKLGGGGIYASDSTGRLEIYNSIVTGNYLGTNYSSLNDIVVIGSKVSINMAYSIYGTLNGVIANEVSCVQSTDMVDLFNAEWDAVLGEYVNKGTGLSILQEGVIAINKGGKAAYSGTIVGYVDKTVDTAVSVNGGAAATTKTTTREYFYRDFTLGEAGVWKSFGGGSYGFDEGAANYGLPGDADATTGTDTVVVRDPITDAVTSTTVTTTDTSYASGVVTTAQNVDAAKAHVSRVQTHIQYNVGAYALPFEQASWTVDTDQSSIINVFDGMHSLSEIMRFYVNYDPATQLAYDGTAHITFAIEEFTLLGDLLVPVFSEQFITKNITMNGYNDVADTDLQGNVTLVGSGNRLFSTNDAAADWTLKFSNINLKGGDAGTGDGGALDVNGKTVDLTLDHVKVLDSLGANGGGVAVNATSGGLLTVTHSEFWRNEAADNGGAVYANGVKVSMDNSLFALNEAAVAGGAIHLAGVVAGSTLTNLTVASNTAASGGGISAGSNLSVRNSILWGNNGGQYSGSMQFANSAIQGWAGTGNGNINLQAANAGAGGINANNNAAGVYYVCFTSDYHLGAGSYVINRGNNDYAAATDLADKARIQKGTVDMGAYESANAGNVVIWANGADIIYGDTETLTAGHDASSGSFSYSGGAGYLTFSGSDATAIKAKVGGGHEVTVTYSDADNNWNTVTTTVTVNTLQRHLTVTADSGQGKVYGTAEPTPYTYTYSNLVTGDSLAGVLGRATGENVGSYAINLGSLNVVDGNNGDNYIIDYTGANFVITKATLTITADANQSKTYGTANPAYTYSVSGLVSGDSMTGALGRAAGENTGLYWINQGSLDVVTGGDNYTIVYNGDNFAITKATLTITVDPNQSKTYGTANPTYTYDVSGLVSGDSMTGALDRAAGENTGLYWINQGTLDVVTGGDNYTIVYNGDNFEITKATLTITVDPNQSKVYGTNDPAAYTYGVSGLVAGDSMSGALDRAAGENTGLYWINQGSLDVVTGGDNYTIVYNGDNFEITKATLTITVDPNQSKVYGTNDPAAYTYGVSGLVAGDSLTGALDRAAGENAGLYWINQGSLDVVTGGDNYIIDYQGDDFAITKATLTITADANQQKVYGTNDPNEYTYSISGLVAGDSLSGALDRAAGENTGAYWINQGTLDVVTGGDNYIIDYQGNDFAITKATLTITVDANQSKVYGTANPSEYTYTYSGLVAGDSLSGALDRAAGENTGSYWISQGSLDVVTGGDNYIIDYIGDNFEITKATLTITVDANQSKVYGTSNPSEYTYGVSGLVAGDSMSGALSRDAGENAGLYAINQDTLNVMTGGDNYTVIFNGADFEITKATLTITVDANQSKVYGTSDPSEYTYGVSGLVAGDSLSGALSRDAGENAGTYGINQGSLDVITGGDNYTIDYIGADFEITKATLTITVDAGQGKVYGTSDPSGYTYDVNGLVAGDSMSGGLDRNAGENAGSYAINQGSLDVVTGGDNYTVIFNGDSFEITKATLTITVDAGQGKVYGSSEPSEYSYNISGLVDGDSMSGALNRDAGENAGSYAIHQGSLDVVTGGDNYDIVYNGGSFEITRATLTITVDAGQSKVYGTSDPSEYTYGVSGLVDGDSLSGELSREAGENAGRYAIQNTLGVVTGGDNYEIVYEGADFEITRATLTITVDAGQSKVYGTDDPAAYTYSVDGLVAGDSLEGGLSREAGKNVGEYAILNTLNVVTGGDNYDIIFESDTFEITKATLTITRDGVDKVYDGTTKADYTVNLDGLVEGDSVTYEKGSAEFHDKHVGDDKEIVISGGEVKGADLGNYDVVYNDLGADITKADLTIYINDATKNGGEADPKFTWSDNAKDGDTVSGIDRTNKGELPGRYSIDQYQVEDGNGGQNYNVKVHTGTLTINQSSTNVYMDAATRNYVINGMDQASLVQNVSVMSANRDADAVLDTETSGNVHSVSHQTATRAGEKGKMNVKETSQKKAFEEVDQQVVQQRTNSALKTDIFSEKGEKSSIVESQYKVAGGKTGAKVVVPESGYSSQNTSFESDNPMHTMPSQISIEANGVNVVNFSGVDLANVVWTEKVDNLKDKLDIVLEDMMLV